MGADPKPPVFKGGMPMIHYGRFGIVNPVIVGGTIYLGNSWDWLIAVPVSEVNPNYHP